MKVRYSQAAAMVFIGNSHPYMNAKAELVGDTVYVSDVRTGVFIAACVGGRLIHSFTL